MYLYISSLSNHSGVSFGKIDFLVLCKSLGCEIYRHFYVGNYKNRNFKYYTCKNGLYVRIYSKQVL